MSQIAKGAARVAAVLALLLPLVNSRVSATWSIIVVDRRTGAVGVAGASCTADVHGIMALAPGTGALVAQAIGHPPAIREGIRLLRAGVAPDSILRAISSPAFDSATGSRQYAIATIGNGQAQFSGTGLSQHHGERSEDGVLVQGNLASPIALDRVMEAIRIARQGGKPLEEVLMAGLKAGSDAGGDVRCGTQRATAAFVSVAKPNDNPNWPYLTLRVIDAVKGSRVNAVSLLETRLARWKADGGPNRLITSETIRPDFLGGR